METEAISQTNLPQKTTKNKMNMSPIDSKTTYQNNLNKDLRVIVKSEFLIKHTTQLFSLKIE